MEENSNKESLSETLRKTTQVLKGLGKDKEKLTEENIRLKTENEQLRIQNLKLIDLDERKTGFLKRVTKNSEQKYEYNSEMESLDKSWKKVDEIMKEQGKKISEYEDQIKSFEKERQELRDSTKKSDENYKNLEIKYSGLEKDLSNSIKENSGLKAKCAGIEKTLRDKDGAINSLRTELSKVKQRYSELDSKYRALQRESNGGEKMIKMADEQIYKLKSNDYENAIAGYARKAKRLGIALGISLALIFGYAAYNAYDKNFNNYKIVNHKVAMK